LFDHFRPAHEYSCAGRSRISAEISRFSFMLSRPERLTTRAFSKAFAAGKTWRHPLMQVRVAPRNAINEHATNEETNVPRAAFVVAKKLAKASGRNRLRRQMREAYRLNARRHDPRLRALDLIFLAAPTALDVSPHELRDAMNGLLERVIRARHATQAH